MAWVQFVGATLGAFWRLVENQAVLVESASFRVLAASTLESLGVIFPTACCESEVMVILQVLLVSTEMRQ